MNNCLFIEKVSEQIKELNKQCRQDMSLQERNDYWYHLGKKEALKYALRLLSDIQMKRYPEVLKK